ncbi:V-set and immunoglobulin domain-containing 4 isoform X1 [Pelobates cultripes]|nr:V-set and immunoglobulin domain-containing 4 isoform X1 [Pelobates cultripes]
MQFHLFLVVVIAWKTVLCDFSLKMEHSIQGFRYYSVHIPCTYEPSKDHIEDEVLWFHKDKQFFQRINSEDHILLGEFRDRFTVSKSPLGDVSLTINNLKSHDAGDYICRVTWRLRSDSQKQLILEGISTLTVKRGTPPTVEIPTETTSNDFIEFPISEQPKVKITTETTSNDFIEFPTFEEPKVEITTETGPDFVTGPRKTLYILLIVGLVSLLAIIILIVVLTSRINRKKDCKAADSRQLKLSL